MIELYLLRHGETNWNKEKRLQGHADIPLNEFGRYLALETQKGLKNICFDYVFSSPLKRAMETAQIVTGNTIPIQVEPRIMEMGFGIYEGCCVAKEGYNVPDPLFEYFFTAPEKYDPPMGGESFRQVLRREWDFLEELSHLPSYQNKKILLSTHGAALCGMLNVLLKGKPIEAYWAGKVHKNCAVTCVRTDLTMTEVVYENRVYYKEEVAQW